MKNFIDLVDAQLMGEIVLDTERKAHYLEKGGETTRFLKPTQC